MALEYLVLAAGLAATGVDGGQAKTDNKTETAESSPLPAKIELIKKYSIGPGTSPGGFIGHAQNVEVYLM